MITILGAGAFGTSLAISLARTGQPVTLWARNGGADMQASRQNARRLPKLPSRRASPSLKRCQTFLMTDQSFSPCQCKSCGTF